MVSPEDKGVTRQLEARCEASSHIASTEIPSNGIGFCVFVDDLFLNSSVQLGGGDIEESMLDCDPDFEMSSKISSR